MKHGAGVYECGGQSHTIKEWAQITGLSEKCLYKRLKEGIPLDTPNMRYQGEGKRKKENPVPFSNVLIEYKGETHTAREWQEITGISRGRLYYRHNKGWGAERTLEAPPYARDESNDPVLKQKVFGRLTVLSRDKEKEAEMRERDSYRYAKYYICQCECGKITTVRRNSLVSGNTKSCGCLRKEKRGKKSSSENE